MKRACGSIYSHRLPGIFGIHIVLYNLNKLFKHSQFIGSSDSDRERQKLCTIIDRSVNIENTLSSNHKQQQIQKKYNNC